MQEEQERHRAGAEAASQVFASREKVAQKQIDTRFRAEKPIHRGSHFQDNVHARFAALFAAMRQSPEQSSTVAQPQ